jgi:L-histidine Nalpha-methyltransferase
MIIKSQKIEPSVEQAVKAGLSAKRKFLPSWLVHDTNGDELFREIKRLPEYYLTNCEIEIVKTYSDAVAYNFREYSKAWNVIELGPGDGSKTFILLSSLISHGVKVEYFPIDISENVLQELQRNISQQVPDLKVTPVQAQYLEGLSLIQKDLSRPTLILFMGANIGNFDMSEGAMLLKAISSRLKPKDRMLVSFDMMKSPSVIEKAYHDYKGITTLFKKNLLVRINRELSANFDLQQFEYWPIYDAVSGSCRSYLVSMKSQVVTIKSLDMDISFKPWETIFTGNAQKYSEEMIQELVGIAGLSMEKKLYDNRRYFSLILLKSI